MNDSAWPVHVGEAARRSGISAKMLRHYETLGLLPPISRTDSGYRQYSEADVHVLRFIKRSRDLGFAIADIAELLSLWKDRSRTSASVKRIALKHSRALADRIANLEDMQRVLDQLIVKCHGDDRPDCPILEDLAREPIGRPSYR